MNKFILAVVLVTGCATVPVRSETPSDHGMVRYMTESLILGSAIQNVGNQPGSGGSFAYLHTTGSVPQLTGTSDVWIGSGTGGFSFIWLGAVTPSAANYSLRSSSSGDIVINAGIGQSIAFAVNNGGIATLNGAGTLQLSAALTGTNALGVSQNGARIDYGAGASDYASSDGTTVTFAGPLTSSSTLTGLILNTLSGGNYRLNSRIWTDGNTPTIGSGFGTSSSVVNSNGTASFQINVGTGGTATSGVITLPSAVTNGWNCWCQDMTTPGANQTIMTANSTTTCTVTNVAMSTGVATAWTASDKLWCSAFGN